MIDKKIFTLIISDYDIPNTYLIKKTLKNKSINVKEKSVTSQNIQYNDKCSLYFKLILDGYMDCISKNDNNIILYKYSKKNKYYYKMHKEILLNKMNNCDIYEINYKNLKKINSKLNIFIYIYYLFISKLMVLLLNKLDIYVRNNIGFEINKGSFERIKKLMITKFLDNKGFISLIREYRYCLIKFKSIFIDKPKNCLKVIILEDLFLPYFVEKWLSNKNIESYKFKKNKLHNLKKYQGVIYIRDYYNSQEIAFLDYLNYICNKNNKPIMFLNIDEKTNEQILKSRLEVFYDMLMIKTNLNCEKII